MSSERPSPVTDAVIRLQQVSKAYRLWRSPEARLQALGGQLAASALPWWRASIERRTAALHRDFYALRDLTLEVKRGESVGIIGRNGSGKSTLLQIIAGTLPPTAGSVEVNGRVAALLELGSGFNPEFTGRENIELNAAILGLSAAETAARFEEIVAFADIGEYLEQPVKTYSSGMGLRLAFAVQTAVRPDILIVDEALAVGDLFFQAKCMLHLRKMLDSGLTLLFVSHDPDAVKKLCRRAVLLEKGRCTFLGPAGEATERYFMQTPTATRRPEASGATVPKGGAAPAVWQEFVENSAAFQHRARVGRSGTGDITYENVVLEDMSGRPTEMVEFGGRYRLRVAMQVHRHVAGLAWSIHIRDAHQREILYTDNTRFDLDLANLTAGSGLLFETTFVLKLKEGAYSIFVCCGLPLDLASGVAQHFDVIPIAVQFHAGRPSPYPIYAPVFLEAETVGHRVALQQEGAHA